MNLHDTRLFAIDLADPPSEQLQLFHFPGFPPPPMTVTARTTRRLDVRMAALTPLSISLPLDQETKKIERDQESFEARVKMRAFKSDVTQKKNFGSEYCGIRATSPYVVTAAYVRKKGPRFPAAPLPFLANKSLKNTGINPNSVKTSPILTLTGQSVASNLSYKLQRQEYAHQSFNTDTPTSITAEPSSSSASLTDHIKERIVKIADKDTYRPNAGDSNPSDQDEDADDEHATESDLETHAGDDDLNYATNPEEEDEGYDSLQSQFRNVTIRKRQRYDVEDAEDDNEVWQGADAAQLEDGGNQKTRKVASTEEEGAHRGKKSRTAGAASTADGDHDARGTEKI